MYSLFPPVSFLSVKTEAPWRAPHIQKKKKKTREAIDNKCFPVSFSHERHIFDGQLRVQTNFSCVFEWTELVKMT